MNKKQITNIEEIIGKTISDIASYDYTALHFTDGTFCLFYGCGDGPTTVEFQDTNHELTIDEDSDELLYLRLITQEIYDSFHEAKKDQIDQQQREAEIKILKELQSKYPHIIKQSNER
jgi:hypothetical protein